MIYILRHTQAYSYITRKYAFVFKVCKKFISLISSLYQRCHSADDIADNADDRINDTASSAVVNFLESSYNNFALR